jgi:hypothetical protein
MFGCLELPIYAISKVAVNLSSVKLRRKMCFFELLSGSFSSFFRVALVVFILSASLGAAPLCAAGETTTSALFDPATMMRASELKPGMKGYGLTVFRGVKPERFEAEVVGVRHRALPGDEMILCKLSHPLLQDIGVVAGMSGSPVYINGKLIGAVAYGWTFSKEPLAGITPIDSMLRVMEATHEKLRDPQDLSGNQQLFASFVAMRESLQLPLRTRQPQNITPVLARKSEFSLLPQYAESLPDSLEFEPLAAPLYASFTSPVATALLQSFLPNSRIYAAALGGASSDISAETSPTLAGDQSNEIDLAALSSEFSGGYALAVPLLEGDLALAGVGTLTFRLGDKLVAFGHPMFDFGVVNYPMAPARIHSIVRSVARPFKLGESLGQIGAIRQDRLPAVGGLVGEKAPMFPVHAVVQDVEYRGRREFNFRVWADKEFGPALCMTALTAALGAAGHSGGEAAVEFNYTIKLDDGLTISKEDYFVDTFGGATAGLVVGAELGMLTTNPYKKVLPTSVDFEAKVHGRFPEAELRAASLDKRIYRPGDTVSVVVEIQPYRKAPERHAVELQLPAHLPDGTYNLVVANSTSRAALDYERNPAKRQPTDYPSLVERVRQSFPRNNLYLTLLDSDTGASVRGQELSRLPVSIIATLESSTEEAHYATVRGNVVLEKRLRTNYELMGEQRLAIKVQKWGRN